MCWWVGAYKRKRKRSSVLQLQMKMAVLGILAALGLFLGAANAASVSVYVIYYIIYTLYIYIDIYLVWTLNHFAWYLNYAAIYFDKFFKYTYWIMQKYITMFLFFLHNISTISPLFLLNVLVNCSSWEPCTQREGWWRGRVMEWDSSATWMSLRGSPSLPLRDDSRNPSLTLAGVVRCSTAYSGHLSHCLIYSSS